MCVLIRVNDPSDPRLSPYIGLRDAHLRSAGGLVPEPMFIAEGAEVIRTLLQSDYGVHSLLLTDAKYRVLAQDIAARAPAAPIFIAEREVMERITGFDVHRGALAAGLRGPERSAADLAARCDRLILLESISNHDNVGAIFRSAACLWGDSCGVLVNSGCCDPLYRKSIRVSMGHALRLPFAIVTPWPGWIPRLLPASEWTTYALTPARDAVDIADVSIERGKRTAIMLGAEGPGLTAEAMRATSIRVRIPMARGADSLNVATAAAIAMHALLNKTPA